MIEKEFKVNEYITLKFEDGYTNIYVKGEFFNQYLIYKYIKGLYTKVSYHYLET